MSDKYELLALHRALFEAKFHPDPEDRDVPGSPFVAALSYRVVDALAELDEPKIGGIGWREWQRAESHRHRFPIILRHITSCSNWLSWELEQKVEVVQQFLAPLIATEETLQELILEGDKLHEDASS